MIKLHEHEQKRECAINDDYTCVRVSDWKEKQITHTHTHTHTIKPKPNNQKQETKNEPLEFKTPVLDTDKDFCTYVCVYECMYACDEGT